MNSSTNNSALSMLIMDINSEEIQKGINLLGLNLSEFEMNELKLYKIVSLEGRRLSEIGSIFILAEALSARNSIKNVTFEKLLTVVVEPSSHTGIPVYCWHCKVLGKCCLLLTLIEGNPAIRVSTQYQQYDSKVVDSTQLTAVL